jgi:5'(3')-deoxyribonucleotidase
MTKKIVYVDMDDTLVDYRGAHHKAFQACPDMRYPQSQYGFFVNLEPLKDAVWAYHELEQMAEVHILTAPSWMNPMSYAEKRVSAEKLFGKHAAHDMIITEDKSLLIGDVLIDNERYKNGQNQFRGRLLLFGSPEFVDWKQTIEYLKTNLEFLSRI